MIQTQIENNDFSKGGYVVIPTERYDALLECERIVEEWEEEDDLKAYQERKNEPTIPLEEVLKEYKMRGYNGGK